MQSETLNLVEDVTRRRLARNAARRPVTQNQLLSAVRSIIDRAERRHAEPPSFSLGTMIRGMLAKRNISPLSEKAEQDVAYLRALTPDRRRAGDMDLSGWITW